MTAQGGGGSSVHKRALAAGKEKPARAPVYHPTWASPPFEPGSGYSRTGEVKAADRENRRRYGSAASTPKERAAAKTRHDAAVKRADDAAAANRKKASPAKKAAPAKRSAPTRKK